MSSDFLLASFHKCLTGSWDAYRVIFPVFLLSTIANSINYLAFGLWFCLQIGQQSSDL